jgi:hypothetical protein
MEDWPCRRFEFCRQINPQTERAVVFADPFGMQLDWARR